MAELTVNPPSCSLAPGATQQFDAFGPSGDMVDVVWTVKAADTIPVEGRGSIDDSGLYTAPKTIAGQTTIEIVASKREDKTETASASVMVTPAEAKEEPTEKPSVTEGEAPPSARMAITIHPQRALLAAKSAQQFTARNSEAREVAATWTLLGAENLGPDVVGTLDRASGAYAAPAEISVDRYLTITASTESGETDKAFIILTPALVTITPAEVSLRANERQHFEARVQGDDKNEVTWLTAPQIGKWEPASPPSTAMIYTAPDKIADDLNVVVAAISKASKTVGHAKILLIADEWKGWGPRRIGLWLMALAILVPVLYFIWPPPADRSKTRAAIIARQEAKRVEDRREQALSAITQRINNLNEKLNGAANNAALRDSLTTQLEAARMSLAAAEESLRDARRDREAKEEAEAMEQEISKESRHDERVLFLLVLLAGALGSFVHTTRSYVDFVGNRRIRPSWAWWYILQPFTGAALAMVVYFVIRGGFMAGAPAGTALNPFGFVAMAALVGLFSKQASNKLDELFTTMFRTDKERELKDKLDPKKSA